MAGIFISYRRQDSQELAGRLFDRLSQRFGKERVFRDIDTIAPGARFAEVIAERIGGCDALIVVIGKGWLDARDANGHRRLDLPDDYVKMEIAEALRQNKLVIPLLVEGAPMPVGDVLPAEIADLDGRNALWIGEPHFDWDFGRLAAAIEKTMAPQAMTAEKEKSPAPVVTAAQGSIAGGGSINVTASPGGVAVVASGPVTIGISLTEYEERLRKREQELREEAAAASQGDKEKIALLEKQLAAAQAQLESPEQGLKKYKEVLASASQSLAQLARNVPGAELERARQAIARGNTAEAEMLFQQCLSQDKARAAEAAFQLGQLAERRIDFAGAAKYYGEAIRLAPEKAQYLNAAGIMAYTRGRYEEARPLLERALAIEKKALGPEHPEVATTLNNLAGLYDAQGQYAKAEPLYLQALAIERKAFGPEHRNVAMTLNNLAMLYQAQSNAEGPYAKAESLHRHALEIRQKALGREHPDVGTSLNNLALLYKTHRQYTKAEPLYRQALEIKMKALGPKHPVVAKILSNLAELYRAQGQYAKAEPLYQQALAILQEALGPEHPDVATGLNNLAGLYHTQGRHPETEPLYRQAQYAKAEPLYQQALAIHTKALGPGHVSVATDLNNLAMLYEDQDQPAKAEPLYRHAVAILKEAEHPNVATVMVNYALLLTAMQRDEDAAEIRAEVQAIRDRITRR